jgi:uncharacterized cupredoxin-like copper-binding protein
MRRVLASVALASLVLAGCGGGGRSQQPGIRTVVLTARLSHYSLGSLRVRRGTVVAFVVHNRDPIDHELIVGDQGVQDRHEKGTEAKHGTRPGEISVVAESDATTMYRFEQPGTLYFGCHLPGHWSYGMHGTITVT